MELSLISQLYLQTNNWCHTSEEKLDAALKWIKSRTAASLNEIHPEVFKKKKIWQHISYFVYKQNKKEKWMKSCIISQNDFGISKNNRDKTLIAAKVYDILLLNHIGSEVYKILKKNQNGSQRNWSTTLRIPTIHWITKGEHAKNSWGNTIVHRFLQSIWFHRQMAQCTGVAEYTDCISTEG